MLWLAAGSLALVFAWELAPLVASILRQRG